MAATYNARESKRKDGELISYKMAAVKIPKGALVNINREGYAVNASPTAGETFAGVAYETMDNSAGSTGDKEVRVETTGTFVFVDGGGNSRQSDVGVEFKIVDNQTITNVATGSDIKAGICVESIDSDTVRIRIDKYAS